MMDAEGAGMSVSSERVRVSFPSGPDVILYTTPVTLPTQVEALRRFLLAAGQVRDAMLVSVLA